MGVNFNGAIQAPNILNLQKGNVLDLTKTNSTLKNLVLGGGWDVAVVGRNYDLDLSAFLLHVDGRIHNPANEVVFYNQKRQRGIWSTGDNRTGQGDGDDETIQIHLDDIDPDIYKIVFIVTIFEAEKYHQVFGQVQNAYIRLYDKDDNDRELCRYTLTNDYSTDTAVIFAELFKDENGHWNFNAVGEGLKDDLNGIIGRYM